MESARERRSARGRGARTVLALVLVACVGGVHGAQLDSASFFKIRRGMNESELLILAGQPDLVTYPGVVARETTITGRDSETRDLPGGSATSESALRFRRTEIPEIKQYHYIPDRSEHDPYLTVFTLRGGIITRIDRTKVFSRDNLPDPPADSSEPREPARTDLDIQRERAERTAEAARAYAETRRRLLEEVARDAEDASEPPPVYRSVGEDGSVYFGDRPAPVPADAE